PKSGTLLFPPGTTARTVTVLVNGDYVIEPNNTFTVNLGTPANATVSDSQGVGTIVNDDTVASTLAALSAQVGACNGGPNNGQCEGVLARLTAALRGLAAGRASNAVHRLEQFLSEIVNFSRSVPGEGDPPRLDAATAALWATEARSVIVALTP